MTDNRDLTPAEAQAMHDSLSGSGNLTWTVAAHAPLRPDQTVARPQAMARDGWSYLTCARPASDSARLWALLAREIVLSIWVSAGPVELLKMPSHTATRGRP